MTILDDAMRKHMAYIVFAEKRPFSFVDFQTFEVDQQHFQMSHGTFRNKISAMLKTGEVEVACYSTQAFYTLKGIQFAKTMTPDHTGVGSSAGAALASKTQLQLQRPMRQSDPIYRIIQNLPFNKAAVHDIRLRFKVGQIWSVISANGGQVNPFSKDVPLTKEVINDLDIKVTIHHSDTVSVVVGCSCSPVIVDIAGVIRLSNALAVIRERLSRLVKGGLEMPHHMDWTVTMWHFGADSSIEYKGEMFHASWEVAQNALIAVYSKQWNDGRCRIRKERQENPNKTLAEAFDEKLNLVGGANGVV
ncbi:MAG: hypothetical protein WAM14_19115 [Candidatus Nitrosopolaris sp.]